MTEQSSDYQPPPKPTSACIDLGHHGRERCVFCGLERGDGPCRSCGAPEGLPHHIYGERKCCPDCDHRTDHSDRSEMTE